MSKYDGLSIGLFGGSFNPAHAGHMHVAKCGLNPLGLDRVFWLATPQNPLKDKQPSYESRVETVRALGLPPRMEVSHMERDFGTQYTIDFIRRAQEAHPKTRFVFLMGADSFEQLPLWKDWHEITERIPIAVIARGGTGLAPKPSNTTALMMTDYRLPEDKAHELKNKPAPVWTFLTPPLNNLSSSSIRKAMAKRKTM